MEKHPEIIKALECCATHGNKICKTCPYKDKNGDGKTCRQWLCLDAMGALACEAAGTDTLAEMRDDLQEENEALAAENKKLREELKNRPEVGFDADTFDKAVELIFKKATDAAYWEGYADALKWSLHDRFAGMEGGDDV